MTQTTDQGTALQELDQQIMADLQFMQQTIFASQEMMELGVQDSIAAMVADIRTQPMQWLVRTLTSLRADLKVMVQRMAVSFFQQKKHLLRSVFLVKNERDLHYILVPQVDDLTTQFELNEFLSAYMQTQFHEHVPISFHMVAADLAGDLMHVESVDFL